MQGAGAGAEESFFLNDSKFKKNSGGWEGRMWGLARVNSDFFPNESKIQV